MIVTEESIVVFLGIELYDGVFVEFICLWRKDFDTFKNKELVEELFQILLSDF